MVILLIPRLDRALRAVESAKDGNLGALEIAQAELEGLKETVEGMADYEKKQAKAMALHITALEDARLHRLMGPIPGMAEVESAQS